MNAATGQEKTRSPREARGAPGALLRLEGQPPAVADPATITRTGHTSSVTSFCVDKRAAHLARDSMRGTSFGTIDRLRPGSGGVLRPLTNCSAVPFSCTSYRDNGLGALRAWKRAPAEPRCRWSPVVFRACALRGTTCQGLPVGSIFRKSASPMGCCWLGRGQGQRRRGGQTFRSCMARSWSALSRLPSIRTDQPVKTIPTEDELRQELETGDAPEGFDPQPLGC